MAILRYRRAVEDEIREMAGIRARELEAAKDMEREAKRIAPVETGRYRDSIRAELTPEGARLVSDVDHAAPVEFGTEDTPIFAVFRKAAEAAGYSRR